MEEAGFFFVGSNFCLWSA